MASEDNWPLDPQGYIFFLRAVEQVGQEQHGSNWTQKARSPLLPNIDPTEIDSNATVKIETLRALLTRADLASRLPTFKVLNEAVQRAVQEARHREVVAKAARARAAGGSIDGSARFRSLPTRLIKQQTSRQFTIDPSLEEICRSN